MAAVEVGATVMAREAAARVAEMVVEATAEAMEVAAVANNAPQAHRTPLSVPRDHTCGGVSIVEAADEMFACH